VARTREYDEDKVLSGAMDAFRRHGYAKVSIKALEEVTGLTSGSIYNSYRDKAGLFAAAFAHYNRTVLLGRMQTFAPAQEGLAGLRALFRSLLHEPGGGAFGCLVTNAAVEFGGTPAGPPSGVQDGMRLLAELFRERLQVAQSDGVLARSLDPAAAALGLLALYQGVLVLVRAGWGGRELEDFVILAFDDLEGRD
jgi:TetR/AcrR family transcriptional repressor of nem operon